MTGTKIITILTAAACVLAVAFLIFIIVVTYIGVSEGA